MDVKGELAIDETLVPEGRRCCRVLVGTMSAVRIALGSCWDLKAGGSRCDCWVMKESDSLKGVGSRSLMLGEVLVSEVVYFEECLRANAVRDLLSPSMLLKFCAPALEEKAPVWLKRLVSGITNEM